MKRQNQKVESEVARGRQRMPVGNQVFWDVSETLLEIRRNERCEEVSSIWWVQTHEKARTKPEVSARDLEEFWWGIA